MWPAHALHVIITLNRPTNCSPQAFNISNGDCFRWKDMCPAIAAWFGMETAPPVHLPLTQVRQP